MERRRAVTLVVVDRHGTPRGSIGPLDVAEPWWPEVGPIADAVAGATGGDPGQLTVLRLLRAEPDPVGPMGGRVAYAALWDGPVRPGLLRPIDGADLALLDDDPRRQPWARPGGPGADLAWVGARVEVTGPPRQQRTWNLSSIWSVPTTGGPVWLKTVPRFLAHESAVLRLLADQSVTPLLDAEGHRLLLGPLPGRDGFEADEPEQITMVTTLVAIQAAAVPRVGELLAGGVPDLRAGPLAAELTRLVERVAPQRAGLRRLVDQLPRRLAEAVRWSPPDTLVHGDPHPGNCRQGTDPPVWFDWGDAFIGNPVLDLGATHRMAPTAVEAWLGAMAAAWPGCRPDRAIDPLRPVAALLQARVYQRFVDGIEETERVYHRDDVDEALDEAEAAVG